MGMDASPPRVLLVDDDPLVARAVQRLLETRYAVEHVGTREEITHLLSHRVGVDQWQAILLDVDMGPVSGFEVLARLRDARNPTAVVMLTGDDSAATATAALRGGAFHYVVKPPRAAVLNDIVDLAVRRTQLHRDLPQQVDTKALPDGLLVGKSAPMQELKRTLPRIGAANVGVLISGESGVGKEVVARALHLASPRAERPFVPLNCGAIAEGLIDSELFGHTRGAFTGATSSRPGVFAEADGGTLFLDEIGDMPLPVQARLLRALQEREVRAVGSDSARSVDVRVIAATNVDLSRAVQEGRFRADLFFRLNVVNLRVAPLRERLDDLPLLAQAMLQRHAPGLGITIAQDALEAMEAYAWPGNVRELENAIQHALALTTTHEISLASLPGAIATSRQPARMPQGSSPMVPIVVADADMSLTEAKRRAAADFERAYLLRLLEQSKGSIVSAARQAGIDRTNFRRLLHRHGIDSSRFK